MKKVLLVCFSLVVYLTTAKAGDTKSNPAPLALQSFNAISNGEKVDLTWTAFMGADNVYFTIEKSTDGKTFARVIDIPNAATVIGYQDYVEVDYKPGKGKLYYRLKQTDVMGNSRYSAAIAVNFVPQKKLALYHLPPQVNVETNINRHDSQEVVIVLRNAQGIEYVSKVLLMVEKNVVFLLDEKKSVPKGSYVITSSSNEGINNCKLTVR